MELDLDKIDWNAMWQEEAAKSHWHKLSRDGLAHKELWDKRADRFNRGISRVIEGTDKVDKEDYVYKILARVYVEPDWTVLDIGCGPGTLAIPLAKKVRSVTALDVSSEMLRHLKANAKSAGVSNIRYINASWEEAIARKQVGVHDVVVASRSLSPVNIKEMLLKLNSVAGQAAYITLPIVHLPFDWEVYRAIGRGGRRHPAYIYVYNMLYQMGIPANVEVLRSRVRVQFSSVEEAIEDLQWRTDPFTPEERLKLTEFLEGKFAEAGSPVFTHEGRSEWALIWWQKEGPFKGPARGRRRGESRPGKRGR